MRLPKLQAVFLFYRTFRVFSNAVTLGLIAAFWLRLADYFHLFIVYFLWVKTFSNVVIWYLIRKNYKAQFWFYHNLGWSQTALFGGAFVLDLLVTSLLLFGSYQLRLLV
ncbi:hypothetical protein GCM10028803_53780 [Larkinella knui]|uniref:Uncharacterized protein n=1 Tax=Larkinella knui TaxID=2025310 RepID=A0A3P1CHA4_9BACT|nr:hypothetical protein [Larkinella knui]RRB12416.1 hypothetical protein EHT87_19650 [Larkinella knui]